MSDGIMYLHNHSGLEKLLNFPKHTVLVDVEFKPLFLDCYAMPFTYNRVNYIKVPVLSFLRHGGVFKNLIS